MRFRPLVVMTAVFASTAMAVDAKTDVVTAAPTSVVMFDLAQAKRMAAARNHRLVAARQAVDAARERLARGSAAFLPRVGVAAGVEASGLGDNGSAGNVGYLYGSYNLFNGWRDADRSRVLELDVARAESEARAAEFAVAQDVERVFHLYVFKRDLIELKNKALALNATHQGYLARGVRTGLASRTDEMDFKIKESTLRSEIVSLERERDDARSELRRLFGEEAGSAIEPLGELRLQRVKGALKDYIARMQRSGEAIKRAAIDKETADTQMASVRGRWLPEVNVEGRAGYLPIAERGPNDAPAASVSLVARMELFSGLDATHERYERAAEAASAEARLRAEIVDAVWAVETGYRSLKSIEKRVELEKRNTEWSQEFYKSVLEEYIRGYKNSGDLRDASDRLYEAELREKTYQYEFLTTRLEVEKILGAPMDVETVASSGGGA